MNKNKKETLNLNDVLKHKDAEIEELKNKLNKSETDLNNAKELLQELIKNTINEKINSSIKHVIDDVINVSFENILKQREKNKLTASQRAKKKYYEKIKNSKQKEN
jgi:molybdopterin/thiamine biosynthesis adenylyltransferase